MKFLTLADWTGLVETELFAQTYKRPEASYHKIAVMKCPHLASAVESRVQNTHQQFLTIAGGFFRGANVEFNPGHSRQ